jgi:hypothetical protein
MSRRRTCTANRNCLLAVSFVRGTSVESAACHGTVPKKTVQQRTGDHNFDDAVTQFSMSRGFYPAGTAHFCLRAFTVRSALNIPTPGIPIPPGLAGILIMCGLYVEPTPVEGVLE